MGATSLELSEVSAYGALSNWTVKVVPAFGWVFALDDLLRSCATQTKTLWLYDSCVWLSSITPKVTKTSKYWREKKLFLKY